MSVPRHGLNGLIYISGSELAGANQWSINITQDSVETPQFGDGWKKRVVGMADWSGTVNAWDHSASQLITSAATAQTSVALLIYPVRSDLTEYYSGNAIFGMRSAAGTSAAVSRDGDFVGDDTLTVTGWT